MKDIAKRIVGEYSIVNVNDCSLAVFDEKELKLISHNEIEFIIMNIVKNSTRATRRRIINLIYDLAPLKHTTDITRGLERIRKICGSIEDKFITGDKLKGFSDSRTVKGEDNVCEVKPIAESDSQYYIICPLCGDIHVHGNGALGIRKSHCKNLKDGQYKIVTD